MYFYIIFLYQVRDLWKEVIYVHIIGVHIINVISLSPVTKNLEIGSSWVASLPQKGLVIGLVFRKFCNCGLMITTWQPVHSASCPLTIMWSARVWKTVFSFFPPHIYYSLIPSFFNYQRKIFPLVLQQTSRLVSWQNWVTWLLEVGK